MEKLKQKIKRLPKSPGVYVFKDKAGGILYIGKAKDLQKRVGSHFRPFAPPPPCAQGGGGAKGVFSQNIIEKTKDIDCIETDSEREALVLEQQLIKRYQPRFNIEWQDGKNYFFVGLSRETFPRIIISHQREPGFDYIGPFVQGRELKKFLKDIRKILPFRTCRILPKQPCLYYDLELCLAPCLPAEQAGLPRRQAGLHKRRKKKYQKMLDTFKILLEIYLAKNRRIEGYDISNISGTLTVGSMVVFEAGKKKKSDYRKFRIKRVKGQNDVKALREVLLRRQRHNEWPKPDLILLDGGKGQLKAAAKIDIPVIALAKRKTNGVRDSAARRERVSGKLFSLFFKNFVLVDELPDNVKNLFLQVRDEAHRFAITYHKKRRLTFYARA